MTKIHDKSVGSAWLMFSIESTLSNCASVIMNSKIAEKIGIFPIRSPRKSNSILYSTSSDPGMVRIVVLEFITSKEWVFSARFSCVTVLFGSADELLDCASESTSFLLSKRPL